jgi:flagella basal body P-ring formation protein FlgA
MIVTLCLEVPIQIPCHNFLFNKFNVLEFKNGVRERQATAAAASFATPAAVAPRRRQTPRIPAGMNSAALVLKPQTEAGIVRFMTVLKKSPSRSTPQTTSDNRRAWWMRIRLPVLALLVLAGPAVAGEVQPHGDILAVVEMAALEAASEQGLSGVEVRVRPLDQRLQPALCDRELEIVRPHSGRVLGPVSYGVRCAGSVPWTLYLRAEVSASVELPVLSRPLPRGTILSASDIEMTSRRVTSRASDLVIDPEMAVGMELKRPLAAGSVLRHGHVALPELVTRGQMVTLVAGTGGVEVRMQGKAMASGVEGDRLIVTNLNSGRRVEGLVLRDGSVRIP